MKKALITGITGQDGAYMARLLIEKGYSVHGLTRRVSVPHLWRLHYLDVEKEVTLHSGDLLDQESLNRVIKTVQPDEIYNFAAQSFVGTSWDQPIITSEINALGVARLLDAVRNHAPHARFFQASTSEMFGNGSPNSMQNELTPFAPCSPYAIAKVFAHFLAVNYRESYGMFVACGIAFNHESPLRGLEFVTRKITDGVARIACGLQKTLLLGNLESKRDWGFAGDYVEAMWRILHYEKPDDFVIATGESHSVREVLDIAFNHVGIADWTDLVIHDTALLRKKEVHGLRGDPGKIRKILGWQSRIPFEKLITMMVDADLQRISPGVAGVQRTSAKSYAKSV